MVATEKIYQDAIAALNVRNYEDAELLFKMFLKKHPYHYGALTLLTSVLISIEHYLEAEKFVRRALETNQSSYIPFYNYGLILKKLNRPSEALKQFDSAIKLNPSDYETWNNRGTVFIDLKQYERAIADFDRATSLNEMYCDAYYNKGKSLTHLKRFDEALAAYDKALALKPDLAEAWLGRGNTFVDLKRYEDTFAAYDKALALKPDLAEVWLGRGNTFFELKRYEEALSAFDKALALKPDLGKACLGRGNVFFDLKRYEDALAAYDKALALEPDLAEACFGRGNLFYSLKRFEEAFAAYDKAFTLKPDLAEAEGARLSAKMHLCDWRDFRAECEHLISAVNDNKQNADSFAFLAIPSSPQDQIKCAKLWVTKKYPPSDKPIWRGEIYNHSRIRVAYLSADFRNHPTSYLLAGVFEQHDRSRFETIAISFGPDTPNDMLTRLKGSFDKFIDVKNQSDVDVAILLRGLEVDIAVDLMGYIANSRTGIFAHRPAPIQVNYLGYPGTMGANYIDYLIADPILIPKSSRNYYSEKIAYLPNTYQANDTKRQISSRAFTRVELELPEDGFVFCCFNNNFKITPNVFNCWMRILRQISGSVLWLFKENESAAANLRKEAAATGIDPGRIVFANRMPLEDHLARHRLADLFLDTLPYNAHTTTSDALWTGLPVITQIGEAFAGRVAASLLTAIGLPELVTRTQDEYEKLAIELATHPAKLAHIKNRLAENRLSSPLFNTNVFTCNIESAYQLMIERLNAGMPPDHIQTTNPAIIGLHAT